MNNDIEYTIGKADKATVAFHLRTCDISFVPPLSKRANIDDYAIKIVCKAICFECWRNNDLIGLIAAYCNDESRKTAFITNVSVLPKWQNRGIAQRLMENCIIYMRDLGISQVELEVNPSNNAAISFYEKNGFTAIRQASSSILYLHRLLG